MAEVPFSAALTDTAPPPAHLRIAQEAQWLRKLGLPYTTIARQLDVSDKTVAKALRGRAGAARRHKQPGKRREPPTRGR